MKKSSFFLAALCLILSSAIYPIRTNPDDVLQTIPGGIPKEADNDILATSQNEILAEQSSIKKTKETSTSRTNRNMMTTKMTKTTKKNTSKNKKQHRHKHHHTTKLSRL